MYEVNNYWDDILVDQNHEMHEFKAVIKCWNHIEFELVIMKLNPEDQKPYVEIRNCSDLMERDVKAIFYQYFQPWFRWCDDGSWCFDGYIPVTKVIEFINDHGGIYSID